jgi:hypothetical protein
MLPEPDQILAERTRDIDEFMEGGLKWGQGPAVAPFVNLGMAIGKSDSARAVVIAGGEIDELWCVHVDSEVAVIEAIRALIQEHHSVARPWRGNIGGLGISAVTAIPGRGVFSHPAIHSDAADSRQEQASNASTALVGEAFVNPGCFDVRPNLGVADVQEKKSVGVVGQGGSKV